MRRELARTPRGPEPCSRGPHAAGRHCTTRRRNAHRIGNAEGREVLYRWHPWAGCVVDVHAVIEKSSGAVLRCSERGSGERWLELPAWMFDRAACLAVEIAVRPRVDMAVLSALGALLAAAGRPPSSNDPVRGAAGEACDQNRGGAHARPAPPSCDPSGTRPSVHSVRAIRHGELCSAGAGVEPASRRDAPRGDGPHGAAHPRTRPRRPPPRPGDGR